MKTQNILLFGLSLIAATAVAQEGELVSMNQDTKTAYYSLNDNYSVDTDGAFTGNIAAYHEDGSLEEVGALSQGEKSGKWIKYNSEGKVITSAEFQNGQKDGVWKVWDGNGQIRMTMYYDEGKRVGIWKFYDDSGKLINEKNYE